MSKPPKPPRRPRTKPLLQQTGVPVRTPAPVRLDPLQLRPALFKGLREDADAADVYRIAE